MPQGNLQTSALAHSQGRLTAIISPSVKDKGTLISGDEMGVGKHWNPPYVLRLRWFPPDIYGGHTKGWKLAQTAMTNLLSTSQTLFLSHVY